MSIAVAGAPCSVGIAADPNAAPTAEVVLDALAAASYVGVDLGPPGYLGAPATLTQRLAARGLGLSGGWVQLGGADSPKVLERVLDACDAARAAAPHLPPPRPTVGAPAAEHARIGRPARLGTSGMDALVADLADLAGRCRVRGHEPVFHPHVGTTIETPEDTDRVLARTDVGLCFDTGHVALGGGDPVELLGQWRERITHLHLKDVDETVAARLRYEAAEPALTWTSGVFCELGTGDVDLSRSVVLAGDFSGWVVIEQDTAVNTTEQAGEALAAQARNRQRLTEVGW